MLRSTAKTNGSTTMSSISDSTEGGDVDISRPINGTASMSASAPTQMTNGNAAAPAPRTPPIDTSLYPSGYRSLSGIALHAFLLGIALSACLLTSTYLALHSHRIWRLPAFIGTLSLFHFLEFFATAHWNTANAKLSSYLLLSNGSAYTLAHAAATLEILLTTAFFPRWQARFSGSYLVALGALMVVVGQTVRTVAMAQAGSNFNHIPARRKKDGHTLVTWGVYSWSRHPSYFGYYWFAVGTQVVVGNAVCAVVYAVVLWDFFRKRIENEEVYLVDFFGKDYEKFREKTGTRIPFIR